MNKNERENKLKELKAHFYDLLAQRQQIEKETELTNKEILQLMQTNEIPSGDNKNKPEEASK